MCGIAGIVDRYRSGETIMEQMLEVMHHRGPDHQAVFTHQKTMLGHLRLSIIDLSSGDQPVFNEDETLCIIYNGELYNYLDLGSELLAKGHVFKTKSDTEVILHGFEEYGSGILKKLNGIFAFAIYDKRDESLFIARDHFGIKPLHYYQEDGLFVFASEQKAIAMHPAYQPRLNPHSLHIHLNLRYTQGDQTLFEGIRRLPPASYLHLKGDQLTIKTYWELKPKFTNLLSEGETLEKVNHYLQQAVKRQLVSDVPIGVYLSGGMDSSTIVQKMHKLGVKDINTFTLGFNEPTDEFSDASIVAKHFNTNHRTLSLALNPLEDYNKVIWHAEEPKINLLQGFNMSAFVQPHVKVVLGGLGGDEIFAGYDLHKFIYPTQAWHRRIPSGLNRLMRWKSDFLFRIQNKSRTLHLDEYRRGLQMLLSIGQIEKYYLIIRNVWDFDNDFYKNIYHPKYLKEIRSQSKTFEEFSKYFEKVKTASPLDQVLFAEIHSKMVNDYLLVEDRMSMAHSVEERVPFLDLDLVDFAMSIPIEMKIKHNQTKYIFRKAMEPLLPARIIKKKKWGFTVNPYLQFKKDLKAKAEQKLTKTFIEKQGIFNYDYLRAIMDHKPHRKMRWHYNYLWIVLGVAIWEDIFMKGKDLDDPIV